MADNKSLLRSRRLLIADDESFSRFFVVRMAREFGCTDILQAASGAETLRQLEGQGDCLAAVIVDFNMPEVTGLDILKRIRTGRAGISRGTNVLMLTGSADFGLVGAAMALDIDAFIVKPVSEAVLAERLRRVLSEKKSVKPVADYDAVEVQDLTKRLLGNSKPVMTPEQLRQQKAAQRVVPPGGGTADAPKRAVKRIAFAEIAAGMTLAEHIHGPGGELLLGAGTQLGGRLLQRLQELQGALKIDYIAVFEPAPAPQA